jgi:hypothetical protein
MTKESRVFEAFMRGGDYNRFEAARVLHDHCLHSTVATLESKYRITISRVFETVCGFMGNPTRVCRYWIDAKERQRYQSRQVEDKERKEAANATDQDKESGHPSDKFNNTDDA